QGLLSPVEIALRFQDRSQARKGRQRAPVVRSEALLANLQRPLQVGSSAAHVAGGPQPATELEAKSSGPLVAVRQRQARHEIEMGYGYGPEHRVGTVTNCAGPFDRTFLRGYLRPRVGQTRTSHLRDDRVQTDKAAVPLQEPQLREPGQTVLGPLVSACWRGLEQQIGRQELTGGETRGARKHGQRCPARVRALEPANSQGEGSSHRWGRGRPPAPEKAGRLRWLLIGDQRRRVLEQRTAAKLFQERVNGDLPTPHQQASGQAQRERMILELVRHPLER